MTNKDQNKFTVSKSEKEKLERNKASKSDVKQQTKKVLSERIGAIKDLAKK